MTARRRRDLEEAAIKGDAEAIAELALFGELRRFVAPPPKRRKPLSEVALAQRLAASPVRTPGIRRTGSPGAWQWWYDPDEGDGYQTEPGGPWLGPYQSRQGAHWARRRYLAELAAESVLTAAGPGSRVEG